MPPCSSPSAHRPTQAQLHRAPRALSLRRVHFTSLAPSPSAPLRSLRLTPFRSATFARSAASKKAVDHVLWCCRGWSGLLWASGASWWLHVLVGCLGLPLRACALVTPVTTWAVWLLVFLVGWWVVASGRGVRCGLSAALPLLLFPVVAPNDSPLAAILHRWRMWGSCFLALLGCWSRQVVLSPFLSGSVSSLCY